MFIKVVQLSIKGAIKEGGEYNLYIRFKDGKTKAFTLSYDDCVVQDKRLIEIFNKYGLKSTFNICSGRFLSEDV